MKKILVFLVVLLAVFAFVSCKQEPEPDNTPVVENGGTLTIRPAVANPEDPEPAIDGGTQPGKFQFKLKQEVSGIQTIAFLAKVSDDVTKVEVRDGSTTTTWGSVTIADSTPEDGWYSFSVESLEDTECDYIAITVRVVQNPNVFIQIKNLKIDGKIVDFSEWNPATDVGPWYDVPSNVDATYTE